ncbi:alkaline phosphatase family protein [Arthrobacter silvisoli]|uniref:alkaline phosphatase family protein n=1 Tax=Arthrobacter silvisoli TaxID=2291022 RepID=UPI000E219663|nr:alkaline phosphatase family protein [Arthrobacter silvisoli]
MTTPRTSRRQFLRLASAGGAAVVLSALPGTSWAASPDSGRLRCYVIVTDGCRPEEITPALTPNLAALRDGGTSFPAARSLPVMETIPNHVMMMTGVRPDRSGVPANSFYDRAEGTVRDMDRATDLRFPTLLERLQEKGLTTGSVLSKKYLYGVFGERASYRWEPFPLVPGTNHAPDAATIDALIAMVHGPDPDMVFTNLGDIDRVGHLDLTGTTLRAARDAALADTDVQVGRFVDHLKDTGRWQSSVILVLADHSMDWSVPTNVISVSLALTGRADLRSSITVAQNGGADLIYWTGDGAARGTGLSEIRAILAEHPGVLRIDDPAVLRLGAEAGDLVVFCRAGWRFSDPYIVSNPIPGNHGHPATEPIPFFVAGGSSRVLRGRVSSEQARTLDVAPTIGALYGLHAPAGGYDGTARTTAFEY